MRYALILILASAVLGGCASDGPDRRSAQTGDVAMLAQWLEGDYSNHAQVWSAMQNDADAPPEYEIDIQRTPPVDGAAALLFRQYEGDNEGELYREARWLLSAGESRGEVVQTVQIRQQSDWQTLPGCEVRWRRQDGQFAGATSGDGCRFSNRRTGEAVVFQRQWTAGPGGLRLVENRSSAGGAQSESVELQPMHYYRGWAGVLPGGPAAKGGQDWQVERNVVLDDAGGVTRLGSGENGEYAVKLERLVWPNSGIPMLRLSVIEADSGALVAYSWADPGSSRIGINLGWIQAGLENEKQVGAARREPHQPE